MGIQEGGLRYLSICSAVQFCDYNSSFTLYIQVIVSVLQESFLK